MCLFAVTNNSILVINNKTLGTWVNLLTSLGLYSKKDVNSITLVSNDRAHTSAISQIVEYKTNDSAISRNIIMNQSAFDRIKGKLNGRIIINIDTRDINRGQSKLNTVVNIDDYEFEHNYYMVSYATGHRPVVEDVLISQKYKIDDVVKFINELGPQNDILIFANNLMMHHQAILTNINRNIKVNPDLKREAIYPDVIICINCKFTLIADRQFVKAHVCNKHVICYNLYTIDTDYLTKGIGIKVNEDKKYILHNILLVLDIDIYALNEFDVAFLICLFNRNKAPQYDSQLTISEEQYTALLRVKQA